MAPPRSRDPVLKYGKTYDTRSSLFGGSDPKRARWRPSLPTFSWSSPSFKTVRLCIYVAILSWTAVCLGIAAHFQSILMPSDLTHFVPFSLFVCSASMFLVLVFLCTSWMARSPVNTRIELSGLGLLGVFWLALGLLLALSAAAEAEVECFSADSTDSDPIELPGFTSDTYHAQYHVLEAFSLFNTILVWGFLVFFLFLAMRAHRKGHTKVWYKSPATFDWAQKPLLPHTATRKHSQEKDGKLAHKDSKGKDSHLTREPVRLADKRREQSRSPRDDGRRDPKRPEPIRRETSRRGDVHRENSRRDGIRREPSRREDGRRQDVRREPSKRDDKGQIRRETSRRDRNDKSDKKPQGATPPPPPPPHFSWIRIPRVKEPPAAHTRR
ncbi:hypothetical protein BD410DRAFT_779918 [Rickenella mellea]|uniref:MARVEL domain-containing protein n=1 Tax=Rickenella mellea TaxID=50990 RepID=A0A4R5XEG9_9AGAM|nr:hypothetical protein BD410DRAFT_779918 [Rickenella mellea]